MTAPDLREAWFLLKRRARQPFQQWQDSRAEVEDAWRNGARAATERLAELEEHLRPRPRDAKTARTPAARAGLDRALDERRRQRDALRASPELRRHREALDAERAARRELAAAAPYEWREYEARLARLQREYPGRWAEYEAGERAAGRDPVPPRTSKSLLPDPDDE